MNTTSNHQWDKAAVGWNQHAALIAAWLRDVTPAMLNTAHIKQGSRVLDIAAGAGGQTLDIARRTGPQGYVLATDISPKILELAKENARAGGFTHVDTRLADAQSLNLTGSDFDAAVCRLGLMFCASPLDALSGVRRALRPGGRFSAIVFSEPATNPCLTIMMSVARKAAGMPPAPAPQPGSLMSLGKPGLLAQLMTGAGFTDVSVETVAAPFSAPTRHHYIDFVRSSGSPIMAILAPLTPSAQEAAWTEMAAQLDIFTTPSGWVGPNELLLCAGTSPIRPGY